MVAASNNSVGSVLKKPVMKKTVSTSGASWRLRWAMACSLSKSDSARSRSAAVGASGAGLGLYITRSLVELHGGRIWFESELGQGSTFHVTFPIAD